MSDSKIDTLFSLLQDIINENKEDNANIYNELAELKIRLAAFMYKMEQRFNALESLESENEKIRKSIE